MNPQRPLIRPLDGADFGGNFHHFSENGGQLDGEPDFFIEAVQ